MPTEDMEYTENPELFCFCLFRVFGGRQKRKDGIPLRDPSFLKTKQEASPPGLALEWLQAFFAAAFEEAVFSANACWACLTSALKATSSRIARSLRTLRSRSILAALRPSMKRL